MVFSNSIIAISIMSSNTIRQSSSVFSIETKVGLPTGNVNSVEMLVLNDNIFSSSRGLPITDYIISPGLVTSHELHHTAEASRDAN